jgi:hypothetical protein
MSRYWRVETGLSVAVMTARQIKRCPNGFYIVLRVPPGLLDGHMTWRLINAGNSVADHEIANG